MTHLAPPTHWTFSIFYHRIKSVLSKNNAGGVFHYWKNLSDAPGKANGCIMLDLLLFALCFSLYLLPDSKVWFMWTLAKEIFRLSRTGKLQLHYEWNLRQSCKWWTERLCFSPGWLTWEGKNWGPWMGWSPPASGSLARTLQVSGPGMGENRGTEMSLWEACVLRAYFFGTFFAWKREIGFVK